MPRQITKEELAPDALERIRENLLACRREIEDTARRSGRDPSSISLMAVTKYVGPSVIRLLYQAGGRDFGESTVQSGCARSQELSELEGASWHLVGHLQRNKVPRALSSFKSIHSIDSLRLSQEILAQAEKNSLPLPELYAEVNISREPQKTGLAEGELRSLLAALRSSPLFSRWAGLMGMAPHGESAESARPYFRRLRELRDALSREGLLPERAGLSMGMSADYAVAVEEGATVVRIGSCLFQGVLAAP
jgi:hypothetical protein